MVKMFILLTQFLIFFFFNRHHITSYKNTSYKKISRHSPQTNLLLDLEEQEVNTDFLLTL